MLGGGLFNSFSEERMLILITYFSDITSRKTTVCVSGTMMKMSRFVTY